MAMLVLGMLVMLVLVGVLGVLLGMLGVLGVLGVLLGRWDIGVLGCGDTACVWEDRIKEENLANAEGESPDSGAYHVIFVVEKFHSFQKEWELHEPAGSPSGEGWMRGSAREWVGRWE
jgi:hypothetical protein